MCVCIHTRSASKENIKGQETTATNSLDIKKKKCLSGSTESQDPVSCLRESKTTSLSTYHHHPTAGVGGDSLTISTYISGQETRTVTL